MLPLFWILLGFLSGVGVVLLLWLSIRVIGRAALSMPSPRPGLRVSGQPGTVVPKGTQVDVDEGQRLVTTETTTIESTGLVDVPIAQNRDGARAKEG